MNFEDFVLNFALCMIVLWFARRWIENRVAKNLHRRMAQLEAEQQSQPMPLTVEEIGGTLYSWHAETHDFVCQGNSLSDLRSNFKLRYPDKNAHIAKGSESLLTRLRADLKLMKQNETVSQ